MSSDFMLVALFFVGFVSVVIATRAGDSKAVEEYDAFLKSWGHRSASDLATDKVSKVDRRALFEVNKARIAKLNAHPGSSWVAGVNHFADYTHHEKQMLLGYKRRNSRVHMPAAASSFIDVNAQPGLVAQSVDWRHSAPSPGTVKNQGQCGSCWATAALGALEMHAEIEAQKPLNLKLSSKQMVDCTPNPKHCGGDGGCAGATSEEGFKFVKNNGGLAADEDYFGAGDSKGDFAHDCKTDASTKPSVSISSYVTLPSNEYEPLRNAVQNIGPVVVSVDAGQFFDYQSGVFTGCTSPDATVNHAVLLVGYGEDSGIKGSADSGALKYWLIRNSWGTSFGEDGYMRLVRHVKPGEHCGTDYDPKKGVACDQGPETVPVCGACGILYDTSYPVGTKAHSAGPAWTGDTVSRLFNSFVNNSNEAPHNAPKTGDTVNKPVKLHKTPL